MVSRFQSMTRQTHCFWASGEALPRHEEYTAEQNCSPTASRKEEEEESRILFPSRHTLITGRLPAKPHLSVSTTPKSSHLRTKTENIDIQRTFQAPI
jgi:hypothetical protein